MRLRVLIAPDKFKGTLTAAEAAQAMAEGWRRSRPQDEVQLLPMSDGGDGFGEVMSRLLDLAPIQVRTVNAAGDPIETTCWRRGELGLIESARIIGLALLPEEKRKPLKLDTRGLAPVIQFLEQLGTSQLLMGIGGSATNDGGFGLARACGWKFFDQENREIHEWIELDRLTRLEPPVLSPALQIRVAVDVQNPLLGPRGASRIYGPQKGLTDFEKAEACLGRLAEAAKRVTGEEAENHPGAGAAGGLGFGLKAFFGASLESGFALFAEHSHLEERLAWAEVVVTGEGALDASTAMGKGVGELAQISRRSGRRCLGLAGAVRPEDEDRLRAAGFTAAKGMAPGLVSSEQAQREAKVWLPRLATQMAAELVE